MCGGGARASAAPAAESLTTAGRPTAHCVHRLTLGNTPRMLLPEAEDELHN